MYFYRLTNEEAKENWDKYGNPDGPGGKYSNCICMIISSYPWIYFYQMLLDNMWTNTGFGRTYMIFKYNFSWTCTIETILSNSDDVISVYLRN